VDPLPSEYGTVKTDSGLGFQVKGLITFEGVPLRSEAEAFAAGSVEQATVRAVHLGRYTCHAISGRGGVSQPSQAGYGRHRPPTGRRFRPAAVERRGNNVKGFADFRLKAKAVIWQ